MKILTLVPPSQGRVNIIRDLLYGCWCWGKRIGGARLPPLSMLQIATLLRQSSVDVDLIDADAMGVDLDDLSRRASDYEGAVLLTSSLSIAYDSMVLSVLKKANPNLKTIVFGNYPSTNPAQALSFSGIDIAVRYEPEYIIRDLVRHFGSDNNGRWKACKGISFINNNKLVHNPDYPYIENLDELPVPDRTMLPEDGYYFNPLIEKLPYTTMATSRGCFNGCTFCCSPAFYGKKIRYRSSGKVIEELKIIHGLGYKEVFFRDEVFTFSKERTAEICLNMIKNKLGMKWICSTRADCLDYDTLILMRESGCHMIRMGVESGDQGLLDNVNKNITLEQVSGIFRLAKKLRMDTHAHFIIGLPGETELTIKKTREFVRAIEPTVVTFGVLIPYPGTPLFENSLKPQTINFSQEELILHVRNCYRSFYLRPSYLLSWIKKINNLGRLRRLILSGSRVMSFIFQGRY